MVEVMRDDLFRKSGSVCCLGSRIGDRGNGQAGRGLN